MIPELEFSSGSVSPPTVLRTIRRADYAELIALFFLQGAASGMWLVPLSALLDAHGLRSIKVWAFATNALAAFVSPLLVGGMADRSGSPVYVLRGLSFAAAGSAAMVATAIQLQWNAWLALALIQATALCLAPAFSLISSIVMARLQFAQSEFGPIRAMATVGWIAGCWLISAFHADSSALAVYLAAAASLLVCLCAGFVPPQKSVRLAGRVSWHARLGLDALTLLKNRDHRVIFIIAGAFNIPLVGFYPYGPLHLRELGFTHVSACMSLAQTTEVLSMFALGSLLCRWRLKWIIACGLAIGVVRFALCVLPFKAGLLAGTTLNGACYALVFITAQIYVEQRVDPSWRTRAQALLNLMYNGFGSLIGYLVCGWWFGVCTNPTGTQWPIFWAGLAAGMAVFLIYFLAAYQGRRVAARLTNQ
ncbi:Nucleoside:H symporter [Verrucomicrobia bacterium]|nr:Nucleoside:H symporter [Verrucomicrobiota bacterium]